MGMLDLPSLFENKANEMLLAVAKGRDAHRTGNIKASGAPLEEMLRQLFSDSLPSTNKVASGYFYGANSHISGEIDLLIYEDREAFRLDPAPQDQHYVPYTSVSIIGQVKNSAKYLESAIEQVQKAVRSWTEMHQGTASSGLLSGTPYQETPLTVAVCAECDDKAFAKLSETLKDKGRPYVDYILLLDRGVIVAGDLDILVDSETIDFLQYRNVNSLNICQVDGIATSAKGLALLWFYFALVSKLNFDQGNSLRYHTFCRQISSLYPLRKVKKLL